MVVCTVNYKYWWERRVLEREKAVTRKAPTLHRNRVIQYRLVQGGTKGPWIVLAVLQESQCHCSKGPHSSLSDCLDYCVSESCSV